MAFLLFRTNARDQNFQILCLSASRDSQQFATHVHAAIITFRIPEQLFRRNQTIAKTPANLNIDRVCQLGGANNLRQTARSVASLPFATVEKQYRGDATGTGRFFRNVNDERS